MIAYLKDRIGYWLGRRERAQAEAIAEATRKGNEWMAASNALMNAYLADFGPNVPVEDLGGKPVFYENNQPVYPGQEKAP